MSEWTKDQRDFREMVVRTVRNYGSARATMHGLDKIFPPIERPAIADIRKGIDLALRDPERFNREVQLKDPRSTWELIRECFLESDIDVSAELGNAPPYTRDLLRFTARLKRPAASV